MKNREFITNAYLDGLSERRKQDPALFARQFSGVTVATVDQYQRNKAEADQQASECRGNTEKQAAA